MLSIKNVQSSYSLRRAPVSEPIYWFDDNLPLRARVHKKKPADSKRAFFFLCTLCSLLTSSQHTYLGYMFLIIRIRLMNLSNIRYKLYYYLFRFTSSSKMESETVIIRLFAWKPLCVVIISVNSWERSTLLISRTPLVI